MPSSRLKRETYGVDKIDAYDHALYAMRVKLIIGERYLRWLPKRSVLSSASLAYNLRLMHNMGETVVAIDNIP